MLRLLFDGGHYVLLTGGQNGKIYMFDPYYRKEDFEQEDIIVTEPSHFPITGLYLKAILTKKRTVFIPWGLMKTGKLSCCLTRTHG